MNRNFCVKRDEGRDIMDLETLSSQASEGAYQNKYNQPTHPQNFTQWEWQQEGQKMSYLTGGIPIIIARSPRQESAYPALHQTQQWCFMSFALHDSLHLHIEV